MSFLRFLYLLFRKFFPQKPEIIELENDWKKLKQQCLKQVPKHSKRYWTRKQVELYELISASSRAFSDAQEKYFKALSELNLAAEVQIESLDNDLKNSRINSDTWRQKREIIVNHYKACVRELCMEFQDTILRSLILKPSIVGKNSFIEEPASREEVQEYVRNPQ